MSIDNLKHINFHERDRFISFDEGPHIYTVHGDSTFTSVTTFKGQHFNKFNADEIIKKMMRSPKWSESKYYGMTAAEIKQGWSDNGKKASTMGTDLHYYIECYYNSAKKELKEIEKKVKETDEKALSQFNEFTKDFPVSQYFKPYRTEWTIYHEELKLAGSIDMVFDLGDGTHAIYDWKRSKEIKMTSFGNEFAKTECINHLPSTNYWEYALQLNIYKKILEDKYGLKISELHLGVFHPDANSYKRIKMPNLNQETSDLFEWRKNNM